MPPCHTQRSWARVRIPSPDKVGTLKALILRAFLLSLMFYTYIIYSKSKDIYYKGFSESPTQRLLDHNENKPRYTSGKGP